MSEPAARASAETSHGWLASVSPWLALGVAEVWLARPAQLHHGVGQVLLELFALVLLGTAQWRLGRGPASRSPLWPALVAVVLTGVAALDGGPLVRTLVVVGAFGVAVVGLRALGQRLGPGRLGAGIGVGCAVLAAVFARWQVLEWAPVTDAGTQLRAELLAPFARSGPQGTPSDGPPVVIVSVDTLRWDDALDMQSFQRLAQRGASWERAMTTSSWTLPSMASLQTGRTTDGHGAGIATTGAYQGLRPDVPVLAEQLSAAGYATAAVVANPWLSRELGFDRGVHHFVHTHAAFPHRLVFAGFPLELAVLPWDAQVVVDGALDWLQDAPDRGFYLWVHLLDPHLPYGHAAPDSVAASLDEGGLRGGKLLTAADRADVRQSYRAEVAHADAQIMRLLDALEAKGVLDDGVVALLSDHGEEFWDHGSVEHGHSHHGEVVDTALALVAPGLSAGRRTDLASVVDLMPTVLEATAAASVPTDGVDLGGPVPADRVATAWGNGSFRIDRSARQGTRRVIIEGEPQADGRVLVYDLATDPLEQSPLPVDADDPLVSAALAAHGPAEQDVEVELNDAALRALGYLE